jgi:cell division protein FtsB
LRWLAALLLVLLAALQYPLWFGKGGWRAVRDLDRQLAAQQDANAKLKARNDTLDADVRDLKTGSEAIEERARAELGMIKHDEVMFQLQPPAGGAKAPAPQPASQPAPAVASPPPQPADHP